MCLNVCESAFQLKVEQRQYLSVIFKTLLTHIQLTNKARKIVVFEILRKDFACKSGLIVNEETSSILQEKDRMVVIAVYMS